MENILTAVSQVGFPIAVAAYSLIRLETTIKEHTEILIKLCERLDRMNISA